MADNPKTLYQIACEAHEKEFGCSPIHWGFTAFNDATAKSILAAIIDGAPYDEMPEGFNPDNPERMIG